MIQPVHRVTSLPCCRHHSLSAPDSREPEPPGSPAAGSLSTQSDETRDVEAVGDA